MKPEERVKALLHQLRHIGPVLPGSITTQYNVCGKPRCRCKDPVNPEKHGPYPQLSFAVGGRSSTLFLKADEVAAAQEMAAEGKKLKGLRQELAQACIELARCSGVAAVRRLAQPSLTTVGPGEGPEEVGAPPTHRGPVEKRGQSTGPSLEEVELLKNRDHWKARALARTQTVTALKSKIRDLERSRDQWKAKANQWKTELRRMQRRRSQASDPRPTQKKTD